MALNIRTPFGILQTRFVLQSFRIALKMLVLSGFAFGISGCWKKDPAESIKSLLLEGAGEVSEIDVVLAGCELNVSANVINGFGAYTAQQLRADLSLFQLNQGRVLPEKSGGAFLILERKPVNERLLDQAIGVTELLPIDFESTATELTLLDDRSVKKELSFDLAKGERIDRQRVEEMLSLPNGNLVFRFTTVSIDGAPFEPHEDAPAFVEFASKVRDIQGPQSSLTMLNFAKDKEGKEFLMAGLVTLPPVIQLRVASEQKARELGELVFSYDAKNCSGK